MCERRLLFKENGIFYSTLVSVRNDEAIHLDYGTWVVEKGEIICYRQSPGRTVYTYDGKYLYNGDCKYEKRRRLS